MKYKLLLLIFLLIIIYLIFNFNIIERMTSLSLPIINRLFDRISKKSILIEKYKESTDNLIIKDVICILSVKPNINISNFLLEMKEKYEKYYDFYILFDDNSQKYSIDGLNVIQVEDEICHNTGFKYSNHMVKNNEPSAWDKVFYYFSINNNYKNYWIIEDDVFNPSVDTIYKIDQKYKNENLLAHENIININGKSDDWFHWSHFERNYGKAVFSLPWYRSMVCAIRLPNKFFTECSKFVKENSRLYFIEYFIHTLSIKKGILIDVIDELSEIHYRKSYNLNDFMDKNKLYHPVKDFEMHTHFRNFLK